MSGLKEKIVLADTAKQINALLKESESFTYASKATKSRWQKEADKRLKELGATPNKKKKKKTKNE